MPDVSKLRLNNVSYDIKDDNSRKRLDMAYVTPQMYGAKADGVTDDTTAIQNAIDSNPHRVIYFPDGEYLISSPILTSSNTESCVDLVLARFAKILAASSWADQNECMIQLGGKGTGVNNYADYHSYGIDGGIIDCNSVASGVSIEYGRECFIRNINIKKVKKYGIHMIRNSSHGSNDCDINNICLQGYIGQENTAILFDGADNTITNVRCEGFRYGVDVRSNGNFLRNIHVLFTPYNGDFSAESIGFISNGYDNYFDNCYSDQCQIAFDLRSNYNFFSNCIAFWYSSAQAIQTAIRSTNPLTAIFDRLFINFSTGSQNTILDCPTTSFNEIGALYNTKINGTATVTGAETFYSKRIKVVERQLITINNINSEAYTIRNFKTQYNIGSGYDIIGITIDSSSGYNLCPVMPEYHVQNDTLVIKAERSLDSVTKTVTGINSDNYGYNNFSTLIGCDPEDIVSITIETSSGYSTKPVTVEYHSPTDKAFFKSTVAPSSGSVQLRVIYKHAISNASVMLAVLKSH